jgi:hypothetical protein
VAYRAEIEIGIRGAARLKDLQNRLLNLSAAIEEANSKPLFSRVAVQSVENYSDTLDLAKQNLNKVQLELDAAGNAAGLYAKSIRETAEAAISFNAAQKITNDLLQNEIDLRTEAARVARLQASGIKEVTQYAGPIGPGPASAIDAPVRGGVSGVVASTIDPSRGVAIQKDRLTLEQALLNLQERKADAVFEELKNMEALVRSANEAKLIAAEATGRRPRSELSLAGDKRRLKVESKARAENLAQQAIQEGKTNQDIFNKRREYADEIFRIEREFNKRLETQEIDSLINQFELKERLQTRVFNKALEQDKAEGRQFDQELERRTTTRLEAAKKVNTERTRRRAAEYRLEQRRQKRLEKIRLDTETKVAARRSNALGSALIGGAFPLLFGQGLGAAAGGAAGGLGGGLIGGQFGFGLSLVGTQIGSFFDQITNKSIELGKALDPVSGDLAAVADAAGLAGTNTKNLLQSLKGQISQTQAAELAADQLAVVIGEDGVNALRELGEASNELGREASKAFSAIAASLAPILTAVIEPITEEVSRGRLLSRAPELAASDPEIARLLEQRRGVATAGTKGVSGEALLIEEQLITLVRKREEAEKAAADAKLQGISTGRQELTILELQNKIKRLGTDLTDENNAYLEEAILRQKAANEEYKVGIAFASDEITKAEYINKIKVIREGLTGNILDLESRVTKEVERQAKAEERKKEQAAREAERVQKEAERAARATKALDIELRLLRVLTGQNIAIAEARRDGNSELVYTLQIDKELQRLAADTLKIKNENLSTEDEQLKINIAREKVAQRLNELEQAELDRKKNIEDAVNKNLRSIQNEIELSQARLAGIEEQTKLEQELATIKENIKGINDADLELIRQKLVLLQEQLASEKAIQEVRDIQKRTETAGAGLRAGFIGQAGQAFEQQLQQGSTKERATEIALLTKEMELAELQAQSLQNVVLGIGDAFAAAMTTGVAELVAGTKSAEEVFSDFLKNVGNILLQTAQQMIATYIAIGIAKAFAGLSGGGSGLGSAPPDSGGLRLTEIGKYMGGRANGGPVRGGQPYMVGERGPELFVPSNNGGVMRNEDMRQLMGRSPVGNAPAMNFTFETTNIGGQEFVSREQLEAAMVTTRRQAANDGAKRGMNMTLDRMQNSPRTRARVGIS